MAKFVKFNDTAQAPMPDNSTVEGQVLHYLKRTYGPNPVDQFVLMTDLNEHQKDGVVTKEVYARPLSQVFGFKAAAWVKAGYMERVTAKETKVKEPGYKARMESHIKDLEARMRGAGMDYTPFVWETKKAA